jgi:hypothetical protein
MPPPHHISLQSRLKRYATTFATIQRIEKTGKSTTNPGTQGYNRVCAATTLN